MGRPRLHDDATVLRLTDAAEALLAEGGVAALSVRAVSRAAGDTTRAVYSVFGGKEAMVRALYHRGCARFLEVLRAAPHAEDPFEDVLRLVLDGFRAFARAEPHLYRLIFERPLPGFSPAVEDRAGLIAGLDLLIGRMQGVVEAGAAGGRDARRLALEWTLAVQGIVSAELNHSPPGADDDAMVVDTLRALYAGWGAAPLGAGAASR
jgi:AcrR family transcriptional regulator